MTMIRMGSATAAMALAAALLLLPGCHKAPEQTPQNVPVEEPAPPPLPVAPPPAAPAPKPKPAKVESPPPDTASLSEDEQIREDAIATGMTSRVHRSGDAGSTAPNAANSAQE